MLRSSAAGSAGFVAYATLRHGGLEPAEIAVFGDDPDPAELGVRAPRRSGSSGCARRATATAGRPRSPASQRARLPAGAISRRSFSASATATTRPSRTSSVTSTSCASAAAGTRASIRLGSSECGPSTAASTLDGHGVFRHVLLAPGHPGLAVPAELAGDPRVVHAYEPHEYAARVAVVGAGMAAATEWLNALESGAEVVSIRRREPARRPLNVAAAAVLQARPLLLPRDPGFRACGAPARAQRAVVSARPQLGRAARACGARGTLPGRAGAERRRAGDLRDGLPARLRARPAPFPTRRPSTSSRPRIAGSSSQTTRRCLRSPTRRGRSPSPASPRSGPIPAADTLVGMKVAARGFRRRIESCPTR